MTLKDIINNVLGGAQIQSAAYKPTTPYKGTLPKGTVKNGTKGDDVKAVQTFLNWCMKSGLAVDGVCGAKTVAAIKKFQKQYKLKVDGIFGAASKKKAQAIINSHKPAPASTMSDKMLNACKEQAEWMKNYTYGWESNPTIEKSEKKGTCVTYVACVLQRLGYLDSGKYIWHDGKGKVIGATDKMSITYPSNKTIKQLKSSLKADDIVIAGNKSDTGSGSHIFVFTGEWSGDNLWIWDNHSCENIKNGKEGKHTYNATKKVIAIVRLKEIADKPTAESPLTNGDKIGNLANEYAYSTNTKDASYNGGSPKDSYKEGLEKAYPKRSSWGVAPRKGASCDVFVGTCVINAGIDKNFPRGLADQIPYLAKSDKFKQVSVTTSTAKDGDIIVYTKTKGGGHICIVYGGKIKEAGFESYYPKTTPYLKQRLSKSGKKMLKVYRAK